MYLINRASSWVASTIASSQRNNVVDVEKSQAAAASRRTHHVWTNYQSCCAPLSAKHRELRLTRPHAGWLIFCLTGLVRGKCSYGSAFYIQMWKTHPRLRTLCQNVVRIGGTGNVWWVKLPRPFNPCCDGWKVWLSLKTNLVRLLPIYMYFVASAITSTLLHSARE